MFSRHRPQARAVYDKYMRYADRGREQGRRHRESIGPTRIYRCRLGRNANGVVHRTGVRPPSVAIILYFYYYSFLLNFYQLLFQDVLTVCIFPVRSTRTRVRRSDAQTQT